MPVQRRLLPRLLAVPDMLALCSGSAPRPPSRRCDLFEPKLLPPTLIGRLGNDGDRFCRPQPGQQPHIGQEPSWPLLLLLDTLRCDVGSSPKVGSCPKPSSGTSRPAGAEAVRCSGVDRGCKTGRLRFELAVEEPLPPLLAFPSIRSKLEGSEGLATKFFWCFRYFARRGTLSFRARPLSFRAAPSAILLYSSSECIKPVKSLSMTIMLQDGLHCAF